MIRVAITALALIAVLHSAMLLFPLFQLGAFRPDFAVFWTGARMAGADATMIYDAHAMTAAQSWLTSPANGLRPFVYPPSALLLFRPFGLMAFPLAFVAWTLLSLVAIIASARHFASTKAIALALVTPAVTLSLATGQTCLLIASAIMAAIITVDGRPLLAGVLLGAAAALKPQAVILVPLALVVAGQWRALLGFAVTGALLVGTSISLWGMALWIDWFGALSQFADIVSGLGLNVDGITVAMLAKAAGWPSWAAFSAQVAAALCGCALVVWAFRRPDKATRLVAVASGSLLCSPYALMYDLSVLMPIGAGLLLSERRTGIFAGFALTGLAGAAAVPAVIASSLTVRREDRTARDI